MYIYAGIADVTAEPNVAAQGGKYAFILAHLIIHSIFWKGGALGGQCGRGNGVSIPRQMQYAMLHHVYVGRPNPKV